MASNQDKNDLVENAGNEPRYTVGQVEDMTGVTRAMLLDYDKKKLLCPARTGEEANNRRLYSAQDIERLKRIVVLRAYDFGLKDIKRFLDDPDSDFIQLLEDKICELKREENRLRNLILFAKFVVVTDSELFEGLANGPESINEFADAVRKSTIYQQAIRRIQGYSDEDWIQIAEELDDIVDGFVALDEEEGFRGVERQVDLFCEWWDEHIAPMSECGYLGFWALFEDDSIIAAEVEEVGGTITSGALQMSAFFVWMKRLMLETSALMESIAEHADSDVVLSVSEAQKLFDVIGERMGAPGVAVSILEYMQRILSDAELMEYLDPQNRIRIVPEVVSRVAEIMKLVSGGSS